MFKKVKASAQLLTLIIVTTLVVLSVGVYGVRQLRRISNLTESIYKERVFPMEQLSVIRFTYGISTFITVKKLKKGEISKDEAIQKIKKNQLIIKENWETYSKNIFSKEEIKLAKHVRSEMLLADTALNKLIAILEQDDYALLLLDFIDSKYHNALTDVVLEFNDLIELQLKVSGSDYALSKQLYKDTLWSFYLFVFLSVAFMIPFGLLLVKNIKGLIRVLQLTNLQLANSESKSRTFFDNAGDAIVLCNENRKIYDVNDSACTLLGYSKDELLNMSISDLIPSSELEKQMEHFELVKKNKSKLVERKIINRNGEILLSEINTKLYAEDSYISIVRDITERRRSELAIQASEHKYRSLIEHAADAIFIVLDGYIKEANPSACELLGYSSEELTSMRAVDTYPPEYDKQSVIDIERLKREGSYLNEAILQRKDGSLVDVEINRRMLDGHSYIAIIRNISERLRIQKELAEQREQLMLFVKHCPASVAMFDNEMRYIVTSNTWLLDYKLENQNLEGRSHYEVFPEITERWKQIHANCLNGLVQKLEEDAFIRKDGSKTWVRWEVRPWFKTDGSIGGIIMLTENITQRKNATELFKYQFQNSPDYLLIINQFKKIESYNRAFPGMLNQDELLGENCTVVFPEPWDRLVDSLIDKCFETQENQEIEADLFLGVAVRIRMVPIVTEGVVTHVMMFHTDITFRKHAEEKLKKSEEKHRAMIENISETIVLVNEQAEIVFQSPSFVLTSNFSLEELKGRTIFDLVHPDDISHFKLFFNRSLSLPGVSIDSQCRIRHKDGHYIWIEGSINNLLHNESVKAIIGIFHNVSERKVLEFEKQKVISELLQRNRDLEQFAYIISHNLRAPVANIIGLSEYLQDMNISDEERVEISQYMNISVNKLDSVIRDLNDILQMRREISEKREDVNLLELLDDIQISISNLIQRENVQFKINFDQVSVIHTLKSYLYSIFFNLISNSIKYKKQNEDVCIEISSSRNGNEIQLVFRDNGIGIDLSKRRGQVFGLYKRFHTHKEGKGMGLYMVKTQVETLGGSIVIQSKVNEGTVFKITFGEGK